MIAWRWLLIVTMCVVLIVPSHAQHEDGNLAPNSSFEEPEDAVGKPPKGWTFFSSKMTTMGLSDRMARTGKQSLRMTAQKIPDAYQGANIFLDVNEGERYSFSMFMVSDREDRIGGTAHGMLVIEWKQEDGTEISRDLSRVWQANSLSRLRWEQIQMNRITAPKGAVKAVFGIHLCEGKQGGRGSVFVDDVQIEKN